MLTRSRNLNKLIPLKCPVTINNPLTDNEEVFCRICYDSKGELYQVCECNGSIKYIHKNCLIQWIRKFPSYHPNYNNCELCNQKYLFRNNIIEYKNKQMCLNCFTFFLFSCMIGSISYIITTVYFN